MTTATQNRRTAATRQFEIATQAINAFFDAADRVDLARAAIVDAAAKTSDDPLRAAIVVLDAAEALQAAVDDVRTAAGVAAEHRSKNDLATDLGTKNMQLFPRTAATSRRDPAPTASEGPTPSTPATGPATVSV